MIRSAKLQPSFHSLSALDHSHCPCSGAGNSLPTHLLFSQIVHQSPLLLALILLVLLLRAARLRISSSRRSRSFSAPTTFPTLTTSPPSFACSVASYVPFSTNVSLRMISSVSQRSFLTMTSSNAFISSSIALII